MTAVDPPWVGRTVFGEGDATPILRSGTDTVPSSEIVGPNPGPGEDAGPLDGVHWARTGPRGQDAPVPDRYRAHQVAPDRPPMAPTGTLVARCRYRAEGHWYSARYRARGHWSSYGNRYRQVGPGWSQLRARRGQWIAGPALDRTWEVDSYQAAARAGQAQFVASARETAAEIEAQVRARRVRARWWAPGGPGWASWCLVPLVVLFVGWRAPLVLCAAVTALAAVGPALVGLAAPGPTPDPDPGPGAIGPTDDPPLERSTLDVATMNEALRETKAIRSDQSVTVHRVRAETNGWSCIVALPGAVTAKKVMGLRSELAAFLGTDDTCLTLEKVPGHAGQVWIWLADEDPLAVEPHPSELPDTREVDAHGRGVLVAHTVRRVPVRFVFGRGGILVTGDSDSGKTFTIRSALAGLALDVSSWYLIGDPQGLGGWDPFRQVGEVYSGLDPATVEAFTRRLEHFAGPELARRAVILQRIRDADPDSVTEAKIGRKVVQDRKAGCPYVAIALDEMHRYFATDHADRIEAALFDLVTRSRAFGICPIGITQKATTDSGIPARIVALFQNRLCHACSTPAMATAGLGMDDWKARGMDPTSLVATTHSGAFWGVGAMFEPTAPLLARADYNTDQDIARILGKARDLRAARRPDLLPLPPGGPIEEVVHLARGDTVLDHLLQVLDDEHADQATSSVLVSGLRRINPDRYGNVGDKGLNKLVSKPFGLRAHTLPPGPGHRRAGLTRTEITAAIPARDPVAT